MTSEKRGQKFHTDDATWGFHELLEIFQKVSRNFWKSFSKDAQKTIKSCFCNESCLKVARKKQKFFMAWCYNMQILQQK